MGASLNCFIAPLPLISNFCLRYYSVFRSLRYAGDDVKSATVIVPARNERGNIGAAVQRIPRFTEDIEIIFVEGHSQDGTWDEIQRVVVAYPQYDIKAMRQPGKGKADAVFSGFDAARGDVLMILRRPYDATRTVAQVLASNPIGEGRVRQRFPSRILWKTMRCASLT